MKKQLILSILMFFIMASVQFSACSSDEDEAASLCTDTPTNMPTNEYMVIAQAIGGIQGCAIVMVSKGGENIVDAIVKINNTTLIYDEYLGYAGYIDASTAGAEMELVVTHKETVIASGKACVPSSPTITNIDSGDVHQKNTALEVQWSSVDYATAIEVSATNSTGDDDYSSGFLDPTTTTHTIPATFFDLSSSWDDQAECTITVNALNGVSMGNENAIGFDSLEVGINMEGASGLFISVNGYETTVYVPLDN
tara:strand:+ start:393 stop:1151 length:759 start_codon:yes stop_codon:yes gene_type:complete